MADELKTASRVKYLYLDAFNPALTRGLTDAVRDTASAIISGATQTGLSAKLYGTQEIVAEYRHALEKLIALVGSLPDFAP